MYARIVISDFIPNFSHKFNIQNMTKKKFERLKLVWIRYNKRVMGGIIRFKTMKVVCQNDFLMLFA